jgi:peptidyl-dipeptidase A
MFASAIQQSLAKECGDRLLSSKKAGEFLREKLFNPGNRMPWNELVRHVTGHPLTGDAWVQEFAL